ncbi:IS256 family transposase, partial [Salmonella enterica]|nr:IS256 family transposase [Salmonella enterica]
MKEIAKDCRTIEDVHMMLKDLFRDTIQQLFEAEMDDHLGYSKLSSDGDDTGNSRNGYSKKTVKR